ncbi:MAG: cyanoglobin [Nannocystales bacterium]
MDRTPYDLLGGREPVLALAHRFYDAMERDEPDLTAVHDCKAPGKVSDATRERFALFLAGWLGGEQEYMERFGHPRLRMRHRNVPITIAMRGCGRWARRWTNPKWPERSGPSSTSVLPTWRTSCATCPKRRQPAR